MIEHSKEVIETYMNKKHVLRKEIEMHMLGRIILDKLKIYIRKFLKFC